MSARAGAGRLRRRHEDDRVTTDAAPTPRRRCSAVARAAEPDAAHAQGRTRARDARVPEVPRALTPGRFRQRDARCRPSRHRDRHRQPGGAQRHRPRRLACLRRHRSSMRGTVHLAAAHPLRGRDPSHGVEDHASRTGSASSSSKWDVRLTPSCVGGFCKPKAPIAIYVDGDRYTGDPRAIGLENLREIAVVIGVAARRAFPRSSPRAKLQRWRRSSRTPSSGGRS